MRPRVTCADDDDDRRSARRHVSSLTTRFHRPAFFDDALFLFFLSGFFVSVRSKVSMKPHLSSFVTYPSSRMYWSSEKSNRVPSDCPNHPQQRRYLWYGCIREVGRLFYNTEGVGSTIGASPCPMRPLHRLGSAFCGRALLDKTIWRPAGISSECQAPSRDRRTTLVSASRFRCQRGDTSASSGLIARSNCATGSESASIHQRRAVGCTSGASCTQRWCLSVVETRAEPARGRPESTLMWLLSQMGTGRCICESTSWVASGVAGSAPANHAAPLSRQGPR
jgi:hypothetical protein